MFFLRTWRGSAQLVDFPRRSHLVRPPAASGSFLGKAPLAHATRLCRLPAPCRQHARFWSATQLGAPNFRLQVLFGSESLLRFCIRTVSLALTGFPFVLFRSLLSPSAICLARFPPLLGSRGSLIQFSLPAKGRGTGRHNSFSTPPLPARPARILRQRQTASPFIRNHSLKFDIAINRSIPFLVVYTVIRLDEPLGRCTTGTPGCQHHCKHHDPRRIQTQHRFALTS